MKPTRKSYLRALNLSFLAFALSMSGCSTTQAVMRSWRASWNPVTGATGYAVTLNGQQIGTTNGTNFDFLASPGAVLGVVATNALTKSTSSTVKL
jgi:hypothetical protein